MKEKANTGGSIGPGSRVHFFDTRGRFIKGVVLDEDSFRVTEGNVSSPGTVLYKHPYMTWEECTVKANGATALKPKEVVSLTRFFTDDRDLAEDEEPTEEEAA